MKDWLFYPLVIAVAAAIVAFALTRGEARARVTVEDVLRDGYVLAGADLVDLTASPGTEVQVGEAGARALMVEARADAPPSAGVFATLAPVFETAFGGREVEVVWRLRRAPEAVNPDASVDVEIGYFTIGAGDSGWSRRSVGSEWTDIAMRFTPAVQDGEGYDYAGLWPGWGEPDGTLVEVERVSVRAVDPGTARPPGSPPPPSD